MVEVLSVFSVFLVLLGVVFFGSVCEFLQRQSRVRFESRAQLTIPNNHVVVSVRMGGRGAG